MEAHKTISEMQCKIDILEEQRDELLEALKLCRKNMYEHASNTEDGAFEKMCELLDK